jgi:large subunit ribosomal protein L25
MVKVPVHTVGEPEGVKLQGGLHEVITREIEIECLPNEIPDELTIDVSKLAMGQAVRASDVTLPGSARLVSPPEAVISHIVAMKAEEAAPVVEGAAPAATAVEPEVIKKGKKEEDEAAADEKKKK